MIDEERLRRRLRRAIGYQPPHPNFGMQRTSSLATGRAATNDSQRQSVALAIVAALLAVAIVVTLVFTSRIVNAPQTVHGPNKGATGIRTKCEMPVCAVFVTASTGWVIVSANPSSTGIGGPFTLYRTTDGGQNWQRQLSWTCPAPEEMVFNPNGSDGLIVAYREAVWMGTNPYSSGRCEAPIFHTVDGGAHWERLHLAAAAEEAIRSCNLCDIYPPVRISFASADDGWVLSPEFKPGESPSFGDLFHTTDSGASWSLVAQFALSPQSGKYETWWPVTSGWLAFRDSTTGFLLPNYSSCLVPNCGARGGPPFIYVTHDAGTHWKLVQLTPPPGKHLDTSNVGFIPGPLLQMTSNALEVAQTGDSLPYDFVYTTSDGGDHWTYAAELPYSLRGKPVVLIDAQHWVGWSADGGLLRTNDGGKHWTRISSALLAAPALSRGWLYFVDTVHGWTTFCTNGSIAGPICLSTTADGGAHWTQVPLPPMAP
jgi:photosystem II stability/assembly factor-like uncharacterized protein